MIVSGMIKTSFVDYPGNIATVVFTPGCNYDCYYCHNRRLIEGLEDLIPMEDVFAYLKKRIGLIDGVVVTGGEPTLQRDLEAFLQQVKQLGYLVKLDTNGSHPDVIHHLIEKHLLDYVAIDYKAPREKYRLITRGDGDGDLVLETIDMLRMSGIDFEVRTTVIPQLELHDLIRMAEEMAPVPKYVLNPFKPIEYFKAEDAWLLEASIYSEEEIRQFAEAIKLYQPHTYLPF
ncbi:MAG: anaerobic ribonucleoside-triphosphate reductase activating protein [Candidatus Izemoplasmatales bacterium]|nr:anaerobic ribonucleoside-triphosphate reductase activating protein [Candidatus Izemoplasmatales bacterium]